jgi:hypothetical protein
LKKISKLTGLTENKWRLSSSESPQHFVKIC